MMLRTYVFSLLALPLLVGGCGEGNPPSQPDAGPQASAVDAGEVQVSVVGQVEVFPPAAAWLGARGEEVPALPGLAVRVQEPLLAALEDANGSFGEVVLGEQPTFRVDAVPAQALTVGLSVRVEEGPGSDGSSGRVAPSSTLIYDITREGQRPRLDVREVRAWALPAAWLSALEEALGAEALATLAPGKTRLQDAGYVVGQVVDAQGAPQAGVRVAVSPQEFAGRVFYPRSDVSAVGQEGTDAEGLFLLVHDGGDVRTFTLTVEGRTDIPIHSGTAAPGMGLLMRVLPSSSP